MGEIMYEKAIEVLRRLNDNGFDAYIVGGYPRDKYLGIVGTDIDICTSATPDDIVCLFPDVDMANSLYGNICLGYEGYVYEITTFRRDKAMLDGNRSYAVEYINSLEEDLLRRDFVMNTLCIDKDGNYVDCLGAITDIDDRMIRTVKDASISFQEDPLRMLRAIRFSTILGFSLSEDICSSLCSMGKLLSNLSFERYKRELDLIFSSVHCMTGISYLKKYEINSYLSLELNDIVYCSNYLGIWAQCSFGDKYPFTSEERKTITKIRDVLSLPVSFMALYQYGMDICKIVDEIHGDKVYYELNQQIPIHSREEINIDKEFLLSHVPHNLISCIYKKIEEEILCGNLVNDKEKVESYVLENI